MFWVSFVAIFAAMGGWSAVNPTMASPDEPAHAVKAAATVRGEFSADESNYLPGRGDFIVPDLFNQAWKVGCYAFQPDVRPNCFGGFQGDLSKEGPAPSHVARYNPVYYALVGLPSLVSLSPATLTYMRLVSALINAVLLALTFRTIAELRRPNWPMAGVLVAVTPMTIYVASAITPQGTEIFGALLTFVVLMALTREPREDLVSLRMWRLVAGVLFFVTSRGLSPVFLLLLVLLVLFVSPRIRTAWDLLRTKRIWPQLALTVAISVGSVVYIWAADSLVVGYPFIDPTLTPAKVVRTMAGNTSYYLEQVLGAFGWGDTHLPMWVLLLIGGSVCGVVIVGLALASWRERIALTGVLVLSLLLPIGLQLLSYKEYGIIWQGKYILPLALAIPVLAGFCAERRPMVAELSARVVPVVAVLVAAGQVIAFVVNAHRYVNGANGPWLSLVDGAWLPPVNLGVALAVEAVAWATIVVMVHRVMTRDTDEHVETGSVDVLSTSATDAAIDADPVEREPRPSVTAGAGRA